MAGIGRRLQRGAKRVVVAERFQIRVIPGQRAIFGVQGDRTLQMGHRFRMLVALRVSHGQHVNRVVVVRILVADQAEVGNRLIVLAGVDGQRCRVEAFVDRLRRRFLLSGLALADVQVEPYPLVEFLFLGVLPKHRFEQRRCLRIGVLLESLESTLVEGNRFEIG